MRSLDSLIQYFSNMLRPVLGHGGRIAFLHWSNWIALKKPVLCSGSSKHLKRASNVVRTDPAQSSSKSIERSQAAESLNKREHWEPDDRWSWTRQIAKTCHPSKSYSWCSHLQGSLMSNRLVRAHKRLIVKIQQKTGLSDYQILWLAFAKGIVAGILLTLILF